MSHRLWGAALALAMIIAGPATRADAQGLTGQISGVVTDSGGGVMPGATVTVKNVGTNLSREAVTGADGVFTITNLLAGTFDLTVTVQGFKPYEQKGIVLGATERLALRAIALEIGGLSEVVSVAAESVKVQTTSGERSATITAGQIEDIGLRGRDFMGSLKTLPGVIDTSARDAPGWGSVGSMTINGQNSFNFSYDGVTNKDTGSNSGNYAAPALDSIAEVKVQASNFQAEYGRSSGATITVVTKSGTRDFHGTAAYYKRNEKFNTNYLGSPPPVRRRPARELRQGALPVRQHGVDDRRSGSRARHRLQQESRQAVLLLLAGSSAAQRSRHAAAEHDADGARALRRLFADVRQPGPPGLHQGSRRSRRRAWRATSTPAVPDASRATRFRPTASARSGSRCSACSRCRTRPTRLAAASTTTRTRTSSRSRATTRWRASTTTSRTTPRSTRACSSATRSTRAARTRSSAPAPATAATPAGPSSTPRTRLDRSAW